MLRTGGQVPGLVPTIENEGVTAVSREPRSDHERLARRYTKDAPHLLVASVASEQRQYLLFVGNPQLPAVVATVATR